jgi:hypothetical protein
VESPLNSDRNGKPRNGKSDASKRRPKINDASKSDNVDLQMNKPRRHPLPGRL